MSNLTKSNIKRLIKPFIIVILVGIMYEMYKVNLASNNSSVEYPIEQWFIANDILDYIFPIICVLPFCWEYYFEKKDRYIEYVKNRINIKQYIVNKYIVTCTMSALSIFIIYLVGLILAIYIIKPNVVYESNFINRSFLGVYQANNPLIFGIGLCIVKSSIAYLYCSVAMLLSLIINNLFIILTVPFIYASVENYSSGMLEIPQYSIYTTFMFNRLDISVISWISLLVPIIIMIIINIILIIFIKRKELLND